MEMTVTIKLNAGKKEFTITEAEARALKDKLNNLFGNWTYYYQAPIVYDYPKITYTGSGTTTAGVFSDSTKGM